MAITHPVLPPSRPRLDPRYVASDDPRAVLRAWGGEDGTMDMGGWTDSDMVAFKAAVQDESRHAAGAELDVITIEAAQEMTAARECARVIADAQAHEE